MVVPYSLLDSANLLLGRKLQYGALDSHSFSRNDYREVYADEALEIIHSQGEIYPYSLDDLNAEQLAALGIYRIPFPEPESEPESEPEPVQTEPEVWHNASNYGVVQGPVDGVYFRSSYLIRDNSEEMILQSDSLQATWSNIRVNLQEELQDLTSPFYLSKNEVSNLEYREFVNWVKDSVAREILYLNLEDDEDAFALLDYQKRWKESYEKEAKAFLKDTALYYYQDLPYYLDVIVESRAKNREICHFDRSVKLDVWDPKIAQALDAGNYYYPQNERYYARKEVDLRNLNYTVNGLEVNVYPDTFALIQSLEKSRNPDYWLHYFWHPHFDNYPVMGISHDQALAYCHWKEKQLHSRIPGTENLHVQLPEIVHYEWALKSILPSYSRGYAANLDSVFLVNYERSIDEGAAVFLNPVGTNTLTVKAQDKKLNQRHNSRTSEVDVLRFEYLVSTFNQWSSEYPDASFNDLFGNLSEWTDTPADNETYFVLGPNYKQAVKTLDENRFNTLFYRQKMSSNQSSPLVGFRLLYRVNPSQTPPK